jgi:general secretion pathway protein H
MRTSVPGISDRARGFTLLEVLVVLAILVVVAATVTVSVAPAESRRIDEEGARLAALFRLAQDESRVRSREVVWRADRRGYRFDVAGRTEARAGDDPLRARAWPFPIDAVTPAEVRFGREPLLTAVDVRIAMPGRTLTVAIDALGQAVVKP